jgi:type IV secretory pathway VirB9-like protein
MIFHILLDQITTIFLSLGLLTTLTFQDEVTSFMYGGSKSDLFISLTNSNKTLTLKPKTKSLSSNLLVITKGRKYYFNVLYSADKPHKFIEIKKGQINNAQKLILEAKDYKLYQGLSSIMVINKTKKEITLNEKKFKTKAYFGKGIPLIYKKTRILN